MVGTLAIETMGDDAMTAADDPRRRIPRTDHLLADPRLAAATAELGVDAVRRAIADAQHSARTGETPPESVADLAIANLPRASTTLRKVINATGVVVHTNIGRAPLSPAAIAALIEAAGYVDVELDLQSNTRAQRGRGTLTALLDAVPDAEAALVVNNGAAALVLATTALAAGKEVIISRGELVEIGDGFRLPDLIESTGATLREVGTTNRTSLADYRRAIGENTGCILKVHPSNFRIEGFTADVPLADLASLGVPVVMDIGSGLLSPDPQFPGEPDAATSLRNGATVVTCSGDKLLGGPQAGLVMGADATVETLRRHPLARALRVDKLTIAALEATIRGPKPPVTRYLHADPKTLRATAEKLAADLGLCVEAVVQVEGRVGGGGAPGVPLASWAIAVSTQAAEPLRNGDPAVLARVERGRCLIDLRCVDDTDLPALTAALRAVLS